MKSTIIVLFCILFCINLCSTDYSAFFFLFFYGRLFFIFPYSVFNCPITSFFFSVILSFYYSTPIYHHNPFLLLSFSFFLSLSLSLPPSCFPFLSLSLPPSNSTNYLFTPSHSSFFTLFPPCSYSV